MLHCFNHLSIKNNYEQEGKTREEEAEKEVREENSGSLSLTIVSHARIAIGKTVALYAVVLLAGFVFGVLIGRYDAPSVTNRGEIVREGNKQYAFISPILSCEIGSQDAFVELEPVWERVVEQVTADSKLSGIQSVSVYFRLLNSGRWFGVNEEETYAPASLLKVLVMVSYLKVAEGDPTLLSRRLVFSGRLALSPEAEFSSARPLVAGSYTVSELISHMIVDSSNDALDLLLDSADEKIVSALKEASSDLNIPLEPSSHDLNTNFLSPKTYSMIFRVLYGSTYLSRESSEYAIQLLSETTFTKGLTAELPYDLTIAHKFGIKTLVSAEGKPAEHELHDCGIVYYPEHPYLLCVMTRGSDFSVLSGAIADISHTTYDALRAFWKAGVKTVSSNRP